MTKTSLDVANGIIKIKNSFPSIINHQIHIKMAWGISFNVEGKTDVVDVISDAIGTKQRIE